MRRTSGALVGLALLVAACGSDEVTPFALVASSNGSVGVGEQRVLFALVDPETDQVRVVPRPRQRSRTARTARTARSVPQEELR